MDRKNTKNTGAAFEEEVYKLISEIVNKNEFMVSNPNVRIRKKPRYYSKDRDAEIEFDVSVEKYLGNPDKNKDIKPSIIIVIECKDYSSNIPVDDVEEFHAKLQQVGADNTKGMMITQKGFFQRSALNYAESKGIALARMLPDDQVHFVLAFRITNYEMLEIERIGNELRALTEKDYISYDKGFFSLTGDYSLEKLIIRLCEN